MFRIFFLYLVFMGAIQANKMPLVIEDKEVYTLLPYFEYSAVSKQSETPLELKNHLWHGDKSTLVVDKVHQSYWVRLKVKNPMKISNTWYLICEKNFTYYLEYYVLKEGKVVQQDHLGFQHRQEASPLKGNHILLPLDLEKSDEVEVFLKVQNFNHIDLPFKLATQTYLTNFYQKYNMLEGLFFGVLLIMALYNFILYFIVRFKPYLLYVSYALSLVVYMGSFFGYLHLYTNFHPFIIYSLLILGAVGFLISVILFLRGLFNFKAYFPIINHLFNLIIIYLIINTLLFEIFFYNDNFYYVQMIFNLVSSTAPLCIVLILYSLYYLAYKEANRLALYYAVAWTIVGALGLAMVSMHGGFLSSESGIDYIFQGGMIFESLLFSVMLAYRMKEMEQEKEKQQKLLIQQNKLASMGEMISTIAHQWRQPLSEINGIVINVDIDNRKNRLTKDRLENYLNDLETVTAYLSGTISDFMNFFNDNKVVEPFSLSLVIEQSRKLAFFSGKELYFLECIASEDIEMVGYKSELIQALLIVINNAVDASTSKSEQPWIKMTIDQEETTVNIRIEDNGGGIDAKILDKIFVPYFTTKHQSKGTGLGLYILKMIIEQSMQGRIEMFNGSKGAICLISIPKDISNIKGMDKGRLEY